MNTQDQKLIELAARAVGHEYDEMTECWSSDGIDWDQWLPLENDGDAFRLMVSLGIEVNRISCMQKTICFYSRHGAIVQFDEQSSCDPCAATRRAIVRAAAAIGEQLEGNK